MNDRSSAVASPAWTATLAGASVVIPAYDEEHGIALTVRAVQDTFRQAGFGSYEVIVVDDGSTDGTARKAARAGARVVAHPHNVG